MAKPEELPVIEENEPMEQQQEGGDRVAAHNDEKEEQQKEFQEWRRLNPSSTQLRERAMELGLAEQVDSYRTGDSVHNLRSPKGDEKVGVLDSGWVFVGYDQKTGDVRIEKTEGSARKYKIISLENFRADQRGGAAAQGKEVKDLRDKILGGDGMMQQPAGERSPGVEHKKDEVAERVAAMEAAQNIEEFKEALRNSWGSGTDRLIDQIDSLQELSKTVSTRSEEWSVRWNGIFDQESGGYSGNKEMSALKGKLSELFTKEQKEKTFGGRLKNFFGK